MKDNLAPSSLSLSLRFGVSPKPAPAMDGRIMISTESSDVGAQLDAHHVPETNGRMSVCRRCGALTDGPGLHHVPHERRLGRSNDWLIAQSRLELINRARKLRGR